ncbi:MAG: hypothetical protein IPL46_25885 [Saprospiraceae bacterium]|nr:hypothetical protein [Saprospiraceae bacterium]
MVWSLFGMAEIGAQELALLEENNRVDRSSGSFNNYYLEDALNYLSIQHNVFFTYDVSVVKDVKIQSFPGRKGALERDLQRLLNDTGLIFQKISARNYVILDDRPELKKLKPI